MLSSEGAAEVDPLSTRVPRPSGRSRRLGLLTILFVCLAVAVARIAGTYPVFNQTWDEPAHIAAGMQWIDRGSYTYEPLHPPLARVLTAIGPKLAGILSAGQENVWLEGNAILHAGGHYYRNLTLARLGVLPFFVVATLVVFAWAHRLGGSVAAIGAVVLFTTLPPVLANAGIATTDMGITCTLVLAMFCTVRWLDRPTAGWSLVLGVAIAAALLSKFSALLFLPAGAVAIAIVRWVTREASADAHSPPSRTKGLRMAYLVALLGVWAGYRFAVGPLTPVAGIPVEDRQAALDPIERLAAAPVFPAPALFEGIGQVVAKNRAGQKSYLLGEVRDTGWWYFFPVALAVKTPIAFLMLFAVGTVAAARAPPGVGRRRQLELVAIALALLIVCLPSRINIGLRHVLPMYPFLAITAGLGLAALVRARHAAPAGAVVATLLLGWQLTGSLRAHPDYLAYFNELAGDHPERILVDSDLDNGQDLKRLADTLQARHVPSVWLAYAGSATVAEHGLPPVRWLEPHERVTGWVAASLYSLKLGSLDRPGHDDFAWLEEYKPVATVGRSIRLYYIR
jgi:4-amino-4-deoxy-L-arabinose transferase-like glycosyltransferase